MGRGTLYNEYEFVGYGLRSDDSRARGAEALEVLTRAWTEEPFAYQGKYFQVEPARAAAPRVPATASADLAQRRDAGARSPSADGTACPS